MYDFILPDIGEGISEALLINWSVELGDELAEGDEIATVSTDKVDVELPSPRAGVVAELCWKPGDTIKVGAVFMRIETGDQEDVGGETSEKIVEDKKTDTDALAPAKKKSKKTLTEAGHIIAAPSTRKLADDLGVDLGNLQGSGQDGRILRSDVESAHDAELDTNVEREPLNAVRAVMADRMAQSVHTLAHSTLNFEMRADHFLQTLSVIKADVKDTDIKVTASTLLVKSLAGTLVNHPRFNATIHPNNRELLLHGDVNLSIAMATDRGLIVPVLRHINGMDLNDLAAQLSDLVSRTRAHDLKPAEMSNGTFTLSNTGGLEKATILSARPVINAPQTATLWVSRIHQRPVVEGNNVVAGMVMNASLSFDHRFIDGADAVAFINDFADTIENPELG